MSGCGRSGLDAAERALLSELGTGSKAPFFGHHELAEQVAQQLARELERGVGRIEKRLRLLFYLWPALTIAWLAHTVATRYGSVSAMELYPHLACLFAVPDLDPASRKRIAELFRHACARLDLPLPERGDAVDGYVVQAGVPHVQIERLAEVLARAERQVGLPDIDDDTAVVGFSEAAASLVDVGHPRLRKVLEHDSVGWYARLWVTLRERPHDAPDDEFTRRLAEAATTVAVASSPGLARPCLAWREGLLAVEVPEGQGRRWILMTSSWRQEVLGQASPVAVPLPLPWPPVIEWQVSGQLRRSDHQGRLELPAPASLAVFAANGRLVAMAAFAEAGDAARPVRLARGSYDLVGPDELFRAGRDRVRAGARRAAPADRARGQAPHARSRGACADARAGATARAGAPRDGPA